MYGDFVTMVDAMVGRVLASLEAAGMADDTLVIFSSDNGPVWYARDVERFGHDGVGGLRGMKGDAWEGGHRMPFIVRWPGKVVPGSASRQLVCFTDVLATLSAIVGYELESDEGPDSFDFLPQLMGESPSVGTARNVLVMKSSAGLMTVREGNWKLIDGLGSGGFSEPAVVKPEAGQPAGQLYDLATDLRETNNLYDKRPDLVKHLKQILASVLASETRN